MDGDGGRASALDYLRRHANEGRFDAHAGTGRAVHSFHAALHFSGGNRRLAAAQAGGGQPARWRWERREEARREGGLERLSLEMIVAGAMIVSLMFYALLGGADYGGGVWD